MTLRVTKISALIRLGLPGRFARKRKAKAEAPPDEASARTPAPAPAPAPVDYPVIDETGLEGLRNLGGQSFVNEIVAQFISEGVLSLHKIGQAIGEANEADYAAHVHALRSSAANVGARRLYNLCLEWRELTPEELAASGSACFARLQGEFAAVEQALNSRTTGGDDQMTAPPAIG